MGMSWFDYLYTDNTPGNHNKEETPVPIPNTEVKLFSADGTAWVTEWESRTLPGFFMPKTGADNFFFYKGDSPSLSQQ